MSDPTDQSTTTTTTTTSNVVAPTDTTTTTNDLMNDLESNNDNDSIPSTSTLFPDVVPTTTPRLTPVGCIPSNPDRIQDTDLLYYRSSTVIFLRGSERSRFHEYQNYKHFKLQLMKSFESKNNCTMVIGKAQLNKFDYHFDVGRNIKSIASNVSNIYITRSALKDDQEITISNCVERMQHVEIPKSINSLMFQYDFNEPLVKESLPSSLKVLDFECPLKQEILTGLPPVYFQDIDALFPETLKNHFEVFLYRNDIFLLIPSNIKIDIL
ncbi:hypothetical protein PPL_07032 [Heterostelium album PN500]|uniref:Uncharacterized protein n=1 Tax=Heterostelium pallidum (strain ATCC 26659 / Pp 5 / PN500) TaxID=670386 RepID=D3BE78_HETP5|nr:hypothetical protein PPL_07032 [Heterostelium album PN500]EFA80209.1 hypothetical protein PPL_07032 [Heterostelium album PN500]|eukprot:XP_020432329.1 hypothetical protein PPL_07032 [Heterostelium album PN500]